MCGRPSAAAGQNGAAGVAGAGPADYFALYHAAAPTCPGLSWTVLAAIGQVETGHGTDTSTSPAGAMGPMQFLPATFAMVAVDGDGDGRTDIQNPADAIFTAAHYLCGNGAGTGPAGLSTAIWNYNTPTGTSLWCSAWRRSTPGESASESAVQEVGVPPLSQSSHDMFQSAVPASPGSGSRVELTTSTMSPARASP